MSIKATEISRNANRIAAESIARQKAKADTLDSAETRTLADPAVDAASQYLIVRNQRLIATFAKLDDALLFEAEMADLEKAHKSDGVVCDVISRKGRIISGYRIHSSQMYIVENDAKNDWRYRGARPETNRGKHSGVHRVC